MKTSKPYKYKRPLLKKGDTVIVSARPEYRNILRTWGIFNRENEAGTVISEISLALEANHEDSVRVDFHDKTGHSYSIECDPFWHVPVRCLIKL